MLARGARRRRFEVSRHVLGDLHGARGVHRHHRARRPTGEVAPSLTLTAPADGAAQDLHDGVTVSGAAGNASGDGTTISVRGLLRLERERETPVITRGAVTRSGATWSTSLTGLGQATYTVQATQSDSSGNTTTTPEATFTVDTVGPRPASANRARRTTRRVGHIDAGDAITFTYSEPMLASSILSGLEREQRGVGEGPGSSAAAAPTGFTVLDLGSAANVKLEAGTTATGGVSLGSNNYVTGTVNFSATLTQSADDKSFTVTLTGTADQPSRGIVSGSQLAKNMTWTPKAGPTDLAGNTSTAATAFTETDTDVDF